MFSDIINEKNLFCYSGYVLFKNIKDRSHKILIWRNTKEGMFWAIILIVFSFVEMGVRFQILLFFTKYHKFFSIIDIDYKSSLNRKSFSKFFSFKYYHQMHTNFCFFSMWLMYFIQFPKAVVSSISYHREDI